MTGLSVPGVVAPITPTTTQREASGEVLGSKFLGDALQFVGRVEEVEAKLLGRALTDDPRFREGFSSKFQDQVGFFTLAEALGVDKENFGEYGPLLAMALGAGAAIANPTDPFNLLKIGSLTRKGVLGQHLRTAKHAGTIAKRADGLLEISPERVNKAFEAAQKALSEAQTPAALHTARSEADSLGAVLADMSEQNELLAQLQRSGEVSAKSADELVSQLGLAETRFEQARRGQRAALGFTSPTRFDQLGFIPGFNTKPMDRAVALGTAGAVNKTVFKGLEKAGKLGAGLKDKTLGLLQRAGFAEVRTQTEKAAAQIIRKHMQAGAFNIDEFERDLESMVRGRPVKTGLAAAMLELKSQHGFKEQDLLKVVRLLENQVEPERIQAVEQFLNKMAQTPADRLRVKTGVGVELGSESDEARMLRGVKLTEQQKILLTPSGLSDLDVESALRKTTQTKFEPIIMDGQQVFVLDDTVVISATGSAANADAEILNKIYGQKAFRRVERDSNVALVARKIRDVAPISLGNSFAGRHLHNLSVVASQLARKKKFISSLNNRDVLISSSGGVQLINPAVLGTAKSQKQARDLSRTVLDNFADDMHLPFGSIREMEPLRQPFAAELDEQLFRVAGPAQDLKDGESEFLQAADLFEEAANLEGYKTFLRAAARNMSPDEVAGQSRDLAHLGRAREIETERAAIRAQLQRGEQVQIKPISITANEVGDVYVTEGSARLTAAYLEGLEVIPVAKRSFAGDALDTTRGYSVSPLHKLADVHYISGPLSRDGLTQAVGRDAQGRLTANLERAHVGRYASGSYRLVADTGVEQGRIQLLRDADLAVPSSEGVLDGIRAQAGVGLSAGQKAARSRNLNQQLIRSFGSLDNAAVVLSEAVASSQDYVQLVQRLQELAPGFSFERQLNARFSQDAVRNFQRLQRATEAHLDELAQKGFLTEQTVLDPRRQLLAAEGRAATLELFDLRDSSVSFVDPAKTSAELREFAKSFFRRSTNPADIEPYGVVKTRGVAGSSEALEMRQLVDQPKHQRLRDVVVPQERFALSEERVAELKRQGIHVLRPGTKLDEVTQDLVAGTVLRQEGRAKFVHPTYHFFATKDGSLVLSTSPEIADSAELFRRVFGEGPVYTQEFGQITAGLVNMSNVLGMRMAKLGRAEMRFLERRLKEVAGRLQDAGVSLGTELRVTQPLDDAIWRRIYGDRRTIGDILDEKWKLDLPEQFEDMVPDLDFSTPERFIEPVVERGAGLRNVIDATRTDAPPDALDPRLRRLAKALRDINDEQFTQAVMAGLPVSYFGSFFPRTLTRAAKNALVESAQQWLESLPQRKQLRNIEAMFKQRTISNFTTEESNTIIKELQSKGFEGDSFIGEVFNHLRENYRRNPTREQAFLFARLAEVLPNGTDLFIIDPILATGRKIAETQRAIVRKRIVDDLFEAGAMWRGTAAEARALRQNRGDPALVKAEREVQRLREGLASNEGELRALQDGAPGVQQARIEELKAQRDELIEKIGAAEARKADALAAFTTKGGPQANSIDFGTQEIWIGSDDAQRMLRANMLAADDVIGDLGEPMVRVPFERYAAELDQQGVQVGLFPPGVAAIADRFFGTTRPTGFGKFLQHWDKSNDFIRSWFLFPIPRYHGRNILTGVFLNWLGGVTDFNMYRHTGRLFNTIRRHRLGQIDGDQAMAMMEQMTFASSAGQVMNGREMYEAWIHAGGAAGGLHRNEYQSLGSLKNSFAFDRLMAQSELVPSREIVGRGILLDTKAQRIGVTIAGGIENHFRFSAFLDTWLKTSDLEAASLRMKAIHYDYSRMTAFERDVLRRVFPFYAWSRNNIPRQLQILLLEPIKYVRFQQMMQRLTLQVNDGEFPDPKEIPDWIEKAGGVPVFKDKQGHLSYVIQDSLVPMYDVTKLTFDGAIREMVTDQLTPIVKIPLEQLANIDTFRSRSPFGSLPGDVEPVERFPGQPARSRSLRALGFSRRITSEGPLGILNLVLNEATFRSAFRPTNEFISQITDPLMQVATLEKEKPSLGAAVFSLLFFRSYQVDPVKATAVWYRDYEKVQRFLLSGRRYALRNDDRVTADHYTRLMALHQMRRPPE